MINDLYSRNLSELNIDEVENFDLLTLGNDMEIYKNKFLKYDINSFSEYSNKIIEFKSFLDKVLEEDKDITKPVVRTEILGSKIDKFIKEDGYSCYGFLAELDILCGEDKKTAICFSKRTSSGDRYIEYKKGIIKNELILVADEDNVFIEDKSDKIIIKGNVDFVWIGDNFYCRNHDLLEKTFGFKALIEKNMNEAISIYKTMGFIDDEFLKAVMLISVFPKYKGIHRKISASCSILKEIAASDAEMQHYISSNIDLIKDRNSHNQLTKLCIVDGKIKPTGKMGTKTDPEVVEELIDVLVENILESSRGKFYKVGKKSLYRL